MELTCLIKGVLRPYAMYSRLSHSLAALNKVLDEELKSIQEAGTWKKERLITSKQSVSINIQGSNTNLLNFCSNNYLGLSSHPDIIKTAKEALDKYGFGMSSARYICGTQVIHKELENKIAEFHGRDAAILFASCYDANAGIFSIILTPEDAVYSDDLNHASIIDGIRLCKAKKFRFKHKDMEDLERQLKSDSESRIKLIATDGVFSMDGDVAPLDKMAYLADKYDALIFIDDCHATGFFGKTGRGTEEHFGLSTNRVDIINSTLGKALGGAAGGYTAASKEVVSMLRQSSRPYLFSNSLPPTHVVCAIKVLDMLMKDSSFVEKIQANTDRFRHFMTDAGFVIIGDGHPICPVILGDTKLAIRFAHELLDEGIYVIGMGYPIVPQGEARIRAQLSAMHSFEEVDLAVEAFKKVGKKLGVIQ